MRSFIVIIILFVSSLTFAQDEYHNDEYGFTISSPDGWKMRSEEQWPDKVKSFLKKFYLNKTLLLINPEGVEPAKSPCIQIQGKKLTRSTTSEAISHLKTKGKEAMIERAKSVADDLLGKRLTEYTEIDEFYDYDPKRYLAIAKVVYKHNHQKNTYFLSSRSKFVGLQRFIDFRAYCKGDDPEEFWQVFNEVIDSFEFDADARPKGILGSIPQEMKEIEGLSKEKKFWRLWKWAGSILTILIVFGIVKRLLTR